MAAIRGLLFDKDGTLFDFRRTWGSWTREMIGLLSGGDADLGQRIAARLGFDPATCDFAPDSAVIAQTTAEIRDLLLPLLPPTNAGALLGRMNEMAATSDLVPAVELLPLFERFRSMGLRIGLATNDGEGPAHAHLRQAGIDHLFDFVAGFDSGFGGKPDTGQMQAFLAQTGLPASATAMVGDSLHDLDAGRAAGMRTVAVLTGIATHADLAPHADVVLPTIDGLPDWIAAQG